jgi:hypothetical protein
LLTNRAFALGLGASKPGVYSLSGEDMAAASYSSAICNRITGYRTRFILSDVISKNDFYKVRGEF